MNSKSVILALAFALIAPACTNLDEEFFSVVPSSEYGVTPDEIKTIAGSAYASLRGFADDVSNCYPASEYVYFLIEAVSDEFCVPQRGSDWYDNGRYQDAQTHNIKPDNAMVLSAWKYCYAGISTCNFVIQSIEQSGLPEQEEEIAKAEIRGIRAYYYYLLMDWFGNVPLSTSFAETELPANSGRAQVYQFVESELLGIADLLQPQIEYGRFTQNVAYTLLARLYINSGVFINTERWQDCLDACDKVSGYELTDNVLDNFIQENQHSDEIIFAIPYDHKEGTVGNYFLSLTYHYNHWQAISASAGGWSWSVNGPCAQPGVYSSFEEGDERIASMCEGIQYNIVTKEPILDRTGAVLNYTENIENFYDAREYEGVRISKYQTKEGDVGERDNDWVLMRYAEILMMKAECLVRLGRAAEAYPVVAQLRTRSGLASTPNPITLEVLDTEWLHEFLFEGIRRSVNIRFGTYFEPWWEKPNTTPVEKAIFPIPATELVKNNKLVQNPGY
ncbi:MAG: RagB/SusD family nutrient uptake outer membrane protein [Bacteroidales bacterium]|nr:RagB/SusD family nutrient uptake outer membrane protein [Bacteroidales bacterium]MBN2763604.1 RagB/SusD family nutrient uptake outer membrane protein [Bacteroidales bacterium]